jgi:hypothetical protein
MTRYRSQDGLYTVEIVQLSWTPDHHDGQWVRLRHCGFYLADVRTAGDLERYLPLADLLEEDGLATGSAHLLPWWPLAW